MRLLGYGRRGGYEHELAKNKRVYWAGGCICTLIATDGNALAKVMVDEHKQDDNGGNG